MLTAAALLDGTVRGAFLALGLTLPGLLLQDSWRYSFFALGRGSQAFLNDTIWAVALLPALVFLRVTGHADVFWFVFAWGAAAAVGAAAGPLQARVVPRLSAAWSGCRNTVTSDLAISRRAHLQRRDPVADLRHRHHSGPGRCRHRAGCRPP